MNSWSQVCGNGEKVQTHRVKDPKGSSAAELMGNEGAELVLWLEFCILTSLTKLAIHSVPEVCLILHNGCLSPELRG